VLPDIADHHGRPGLGQCFGHPGPQPLGPASHQRLPLGQFVHAHQAPLPWGGGPAWTRPNAGPCDVPHSLAVSLDNCQEMPRHSSKEIWSIVKAAKGGDARPVKLLRVAGARGAEGTLRVTEVAERNRDRIARRQVDKFAERRAQLAAAALQTLAEQGYARTSLRDIAQHSDFSHGVLHYYFSDKIELITYCVRQYKAECVTRYDSIVATAASA